MANTNEIKNWRRNAHQRLADAKLLYEHDRPEAAANRINYAAQILCNFGHTTSCILI